MRSYILCGLLYFSLCHTLYGQDENAIHERVDELILSSKFPEALDLLEDASRKGSSLLLDIKRAEILTREGAFDKAKQILTRVQSELTGQPNHFLHALADINLGFLQLNEGRGDLAEESLQRAIGSLESQGKDDRPELAQALSHLGLLYLSQGKYTQAQDQLHRVLSIRRKLEKNKEAFLAATYNDLGLAYSQTDKDLALDFYEQAHEIYLALYGRQDPKIAIANVNIGIIYRDLGLFGDALNNFETALNIWNAVYHQPHPGKAIALYNLGQTYLQLHDEKSAGEFYTKAHKMYVDCYGPKHPEVASVLNAMGNLELAQSHFDDALRLYHSAVQANVQDFDVADVMVNPSLNHYYSGTRLLHSFLFKAEAFEARYTRKSLKFSDLRAALDVLTRCDSLIDQLRHHSTNESDKLLLGQIADEVYTNGVRIAYLAGLNALRKEPFSEKAFYFAEKSKSAVLLEAISEANAKSFAGIPNALLEEEKDIKSALALTAQKLAEKPSPGEERLLRENSYNLKRRYGAFIAKLEREYPAYYNLKFNHAAPSIPEIQSLLGDNEALVSYFIDEKNKQVYLFLLRKQQYRVLQRPLPGDFDKYITGLRNGLYFQEINTYRTSAFILGRALIPPLPASVNELVIVPAGRLGLLPFETLLTAESNGIVDYNSMPYLLKDFSIRYEFSAGLLLQKASQEAVDGEPSVFLCAPVSFPQRPYLGELPGTASEVSEISNLFASKNLKTIAYTNLQANEELIKTQPLKDYRFLHFATHGVVDELSPELSRIFLQSGPRNDGDLYAGEIYNLELNASLVTLSACQTGLGKIVKGEGVVGLSRALVYAGAKNVMVSYWKVADESTAVLMKSFYKSVLESPGVSYSHSLRTAKMQLLSDQKFSAPFYWAPFVLIGF